MRMLLYSIMQKHVTHDVMSIFYHLGIFCVYPASSCWQDCWLGPRFHVFPQETWSPNILAKLPLQENFLWISSIQEGDQRALLSIFAVTLHCTVSHPITNLRIEGWRSWMKCNISFISKKANVFDFLELYAAALILQQNHCPVFLSPLRKAIAKETHQMHFPPDSLPREMFSEIWQTRLVERREAFLCSSPSPS